MADNQSMDSATPQPRRSMVMLQELEGGTMIRLRDGRVAEVTTNPRDGSWIYVHPSGSPDGEEELVFAEEVVDLAE